MKKVYLVLFVFLLSAACVQTNPPATGMYNKKISVSGNSLWVFVADNDTTRAQGLSGQEKLSDSQGMLFSFTGTPYTKPGFWMKDMKFNLDLIWIKNKKIIGITTDVPAPPVNDKGFTVNDNLPLYYPPSEIDYVLEVDAGWSAAHGVKVGDGVNF